jgi:hypothetical protein
MLAEAEIDTLWRSFLEHQSAYYVAKKCRVTPATVRKYRRVRRWDDRLQQIHSKASALADQKAAQQRAKAMLGLHALNQQILASLDEQLEAGTYTPTVRDAERMLKLEHTLGDWLYHSPEHKVSFEWLDDEEEDSEDSDSGLVREW